MSEKYPLPKNLATPRLQKLNHPWNRGYPNNKRVMRAFGAMAGVPVVGKKPAVEPAI